MMSDKYTHEGQASSSGNMFTVDGTFPEHGDVKMKNMQNVQLTKGIDSHLYALKNRQTASLSAVTKKRNALSKLLTSNSNNVHLVKIGFDVFNKLCSQYERSHMDYVNELKSVEECRRQQEMFGAKQESILEFQNRVLDWIYRAEHQVLDQIRSVSECGSSQSHSSQSSKHTKSSSVSSLASARAKEKARIAELLIEKSVMKKKQALQAEGEELTLETELAKAQARERVYAEASLERELTEPSIPIEVKQEKVQEINPHLAQHHVLFTDRSVGPGLTEQTFPQEEQQFPVSVASNTGQSGTVLHHTENPPRDFNMTSNRSGAPGLIHHMHSERDEQSVGISTRNQVSTAIYGIGNPPGDLNESLYRSEALKSTGETYSQKHPLSPASPTSMTSQMGTIHAAAEASQFRLNPSASEFHPYTGPRNEQTSLSSTAFPYQQLITAMTLPQPEVPKFCGDPKDYRTFIMAFDTRISSRTSNDADKLYYLHQLLQDEPQEIISSCLHMRPEDGYQEARQMLEKHYGDPYIVSMSYINQALKWSPIKFDDSSGLKRFSLFLTRCYNAMKSISHMSVLNHPTNMQAIVQKLPISLQNKWRDHVTSLRKHQRVADFADLSSFIAYASESANDPLYSRAALGGSNQRQSTTVQKSSSVKQKSSSFATDVQMSNQKQLKKQDRNRCPLCSQVHDIESCKDFVKKKVEDRRDILMKKSLCFGCYGQGHVSKGCRRRRSCSTCGKKHPTLLHDDNYVKMQKSEETYPKVVSEQSNGSHQTDNKSSDFKISSCTATNVDDVLVLHSILPVKVSPSGGSCSVATYAFLDNGSSGCFVTKDLAEELGADGETTLLQLKTMHGQSCVESAVIQGLTVSDLNGDNPIVLPKTYTRDEIPVDKTQVPKPDFIRKWPELRDIARRLPDYDPNLKIGLLIGNNCTSMMAPLEAVNSKESGLFAIRYLHGWTVNGPLRITMKSEASKIVCNQLVLQEMNQVKEVISPEAVLNVFEQDFRDTISEVPDQRGLSYNDRMFLQRMESCVQLPNFHHEIPLPFCHPDISMPNNRDQAISRLKWQRKKMQRDKKYYEDYCNFIDSLLIKEYARKIPEDELSTSPGKVWYLPHHGVYHPRKPNKIRVVFDCSARYNNTSLNDQLLQGPDLANSLVGVLLRFRQDHVAFIADIEAMFHQVCVPRAQCDFLRFLWFPNNDLSLDAEEYQMTVHLFGAKSSPSVCNYALQKTARDNYDQIGPNVAKTILQDFYVDDCLKSVGTKSEAVQLIKDLQNGCAAGGFHLTKFLCNDRDVLRTIPMEECSKELQCRDLNYDNLPVEHALGVQWKVESDVFGFSVTPKDKPWTRRGILSVVSSVFDPLGMAAPFILPAKQMLQDLCSRESLGWDDSIPENYRSRWLKWFHDLPILDQLSINRCVLPSNLTEITSCQLHVFSDASTGGYGSVAYLRIGNREEKFHVSFLIGKARVTPLKTVTVPKLELTAATVSVRLGKFIQRELDIKLDEIFYHTDSITVLRYICNDDKRFPVFIANRLQLIRDYTKPSQWRYVESNVNPADDASRGISAAKLIQHSDWLNGPDFLKLPESEWPEQPFISQIASSDSKVTSAATTCNQSTAVEKLINHYSSWYRLLRAIAIYARVKDILQKRNQTRSTGKKSDHAGSEHRNTPLSLEELDHAELFLIKYTQMQYFHEEIAQLNQQRDEPDRLTRSRAAIKKSSPLYRLSPWLDNGIVKVGGRLKNATLSDEMKYPVILPRSSHLTTLLIRHTHEQLGHAGRNHVLSKLREKYWILGANTAVRHLLYNCVRCRKIRGPVAGQKMGDLPPERVNPSPPFTYTGIDYFGPYLIKEGRKVMKRYGVLFTCLASRSVHIETANSLETDSFINALRRFIARRGNVKEIRSDNATNFVGAEKELCQIVQNLDREQIGSKLLKRGIQWKFNPPTASHQGGVWERLIRSVRKILAALLQEFGSRLDDESLRTLFCEIEAILNSRPLTYITSDTHDIEPLTPNHILTLKSCSIRPPPGNFKDHDVYVRQRWKRVQYLANLFWTRWKKEYLCILQPRQKWNTVQRNMQIGDVVLLKDDNLPRNRWSLGVITATEPDKHGLVRSVHVKTQFNQLRRPVQKLVLLLPKLSEG